MLLIYHGTVLLSNHRVILRQRYHVTHNERKDMSEEALNGQHTVLK